jgi:hypothetical protein
MRWGIIPSILQFPGQFLIPAFLLSTFFEPLLCLLLVSLHITECV